VRFSQGGTVVVAAVFGPRAAPFARQMLPERAAVEAVWKPAAGQTTDAEREHESVLRQLAEGSIVLELHPRTVVQIVIQVECDEGAVLAAAMNAACCALIDAGVPLRHTWAAASCAVGAGGELLLDPTEDDEAAAAARWTMAFEGVAAVEGGGAEAAADTKLLSCTSSGCVAEAAWWEGMATGRAAAATVSAFLRKHQEHHFSRTNTV